MNHTRNYRDYQYKDAVFRICCDAFDAVTFEIRSQRHLLEAYIQSHAEFGTALEPIDVLTNAPDVAQSMARAAKLVGVGPMAAVAGAMAQKAALAGLNQGALEAIVENGGDIFLKTVTPVVIGLAPGTDSLTGRLGFDIQPQDTPIAICSSSSRMGHSMSLGQCDLATVVAKDAALADAAATQAANWVKTEQDVNPALERIMAIPDIQGVLIVKNEQVGLAGKLPSLVKIH